MIFRRLRDIAVERKGPPRQIQAAAEARDSETLGKLSARKVAIEAEVTAATIADREAEIGVFDVDLAEASARAVELTNAMPAKVAQLKEAREDLQARLEQNGKDLQRVTHEETVARQVVDDLRAKIEGARQALSRYVKESAERAAA